MVTKQKIKKAVMKSPKPVGVMKGKMQITNAQRRKLKTLKKDELLQLTKLAGIDENKLASDTKSELAHVLARNEKIKVALAGAAGGAVTGAVLFRGLSRLLECRKQKAAIEDQLSVSEKKFDELSEEEKEDLFRQVPIILRNKYKHLRC